MILLFHHHHTKIEKIDLVSSNSPSYQLDKVVVEGDASSSIKDGGTLVTNEVRGHNLRKEEEEEEEERLKWGD